MGVLRIFHELQNSWFSPSFVHQKNRWFDLLGNYESILNIQKLQLNVIEDDVKLNAGWLKKKGFLLMIQLAIDEGNYFKLKHLNKLNSLNALNWPININNSCKLVQFKLTQQKLLDCI
jgi:hypothetical protein